MMFSFSGLNPNIGNNFYSLSVTLYSVDGDILSNVNRDFTAGEFDGECRVVTKPEYVQLEPLTKLK